MKTNLAIPKLVSRPYHFLLIAGSHRLLTAVMGLVILCTFFISHSAEARRDQPLIERPVSAFPASCQEVRALNSEAADGDYTLYLNNFPEGAFSIYCHNMATEPAEYLPLVFTDESHNFSRAAAGGAWSGEDVITRFYRVRIDSRTMIIDPTDLAFASSTGHLVGAGHDFTERDYAWAGSCRARNDSSGTASVDLRDTSFSIDPSVDFSYGSPADSYYPGGTTTFSSDRQVVDLTGGGYCGRNTLATPMKLKYVGSHTVSGRVTTREGVPIPGVLVAAGPTSQATTDDAGDYTIGNLLPGTYALVLSKESYVFAPRLPATGISVPPDRTGVDFIGVPPQIFALVSDTDTTYLSDTGWQPSVRAWMHSGWPALPDAAWIWKSYLVTPDEAQYGIPMVTFRRAFSLPWNAQDIHSQIRITADNAYEVDLNGKLIGADSDFSTIETYPLDAQPGDNELMMRVSNSAEPTTRDPRANPAGLLFRMDLTYSLADRPSAQGTLSFSPGAVYNPSQPIWFASSVKNNTATPYTFRVIMRLLRDGAVVDTQSLDVNLAGGNSSVLSHNFAVRPTGQYQVRGELWLGGILLAARSADVTVLDAGAQRVAEEYATELKQTAREEFDQMADIPAKIVGSSITDWGWDKVTSLFSSYFGQAAAPAKEADPSGASDANVEKGLQEGRKLLGEAGDKVRVYTAGRLRAMIYQRTGVLLPEWFDPLNPDASLSGLTDDMKDQVKKIIKDEVTAVVKEYFFKAGFTEPQMRQIEARDGQFDAFLLGHPVNWTPALEGIFNRGRDAIRNTVESDAIVTLGPVDVLGRTVRYDVTLLEQQRKYEEVKQLKGTLAAISQALTVVGVVLALLIFIGAIAGTGGLATTLLPLLWKTVAFLGKIKSVVLPLALTFLTVTITVSVPILAPRVTTKHDQTLDQVEALAGTTGHSVALTELAVTSASAGEPVHANALVKNTSDNETARPLVETTIYSVDGRVIQVLWAEPTLGPGQSAQLDKEIALPQGDYRAVTAIHTAEGLVGEAVTQPFTVSGAELQTGVRLERTTLGLGAPVHATVVVTNTSPTSAAKNLTLVVEASDGQNFQAWPVSLGAGQTWQTSYSFVPPAEGSYFLRASLSSGFDALAAADASYVVGSGPSLAVGITAQAVYAPGAAIVFPLSVANNGNAASAATLKAITLDRLHDLTAVYTTTLPVNLAAGAQTTLNAVALPVALAQPGLYTTRFFVGDLLYRTLDFAVSAQDTLFADVSPDQVYRNASDTVALEVQVLNAAYAPTDAAVAVSVRRPDGVTQAVAMNAAGVGKYQGSMVAALAGTYVVNATVTKAGYRSVGNESFFVAGQRSQLVPNVQGQPLLGNTQPLTVTVRNERGAVVPAATLTISNSTEVVTAHTDQAGQAMIQLSPAITETYHVTIEKMGFDRTLDDWPVWVGEDYTPPVLFVDAPSVTNRASLTISGLTEPGATVTLNSQPLSVDAQGRFSKSLTLAAGANTFTFTAKDKANNTTTVARSITLDTTPPNLTVTEPADGLTTGLEAIRVSGVTEPGAVVTVNDVVSAVNPSNGAYSAWAVLQPGANSIVVTATDQAGNVRTVTRRINRVLRVYLPLVRR